jgi:predicted nucleic acid-binding protein
VTLFLDTSAIVSSVVESSGRPIVLAALEGDSEWCASNLALAEALALITPLTDEEILRDDIEDSIRLLWDRLAIVPVDQMCLDRAAAIARSQPIRIGNAIHLAAAERLPRPLRFVTFDPAQIPVALSLGFDVMSS